MHTSRHVSEQTATAIDDEVKRIIDECYARAHQIIRENRHVLNACAALLLENEKITREEFEALFEEPAAEEAVVEGEEPAAGENA